MTSSCSAAGIDFPHWICEHSDYFFLSLHIAFLALLFDTISIAAYDFMCPNLRTLSAHSGLSANVIGVVFVAFGNSSVDIFGAIAALSVGANALAVGELIGAALFISTVVVGSMALFGPIEVESRFFKRDGRFLLLASVVVLYIIWDGVITLIEVMSLLALYVVYAIVVAMDHFDDSKSQEEAYSEVTRNIGIYHGELSEESAIPGSPLPPVRSSLLSAHEFHDAVVDGMSPQTGVGSSRSSLLFGRSPLLPPGGAPISPGYTGATPRGSIVKLPEGALESSPENSHQQTHTSHSPQRYIPSLNLEQDDEEQAQERPVLASLVITSAGDEIDQTPRLHVESDTTPLLSPLPPSHTVWTHLFPSFRDFHQKHWLVQLHSFIMVLPIFGLAVSVPVTGDHAIPSVAYLVHSIGSPVALLLLVKHTYLAIGAIIGTLILLYVAYKRPYSLALTMLGFGMSVMWVVNLAELVIVELRIIGQALGISETFMGLTVFAIGDSLGDLVTNISIAQLGMSTMAVSACFAGPFMTMLIGIGLGALISMVMTKKTVIDMPVDRQIFVAGPLLVAVLAGLQFAVKQNNWKLTPMMGRVLIGLWVLSVIINISIS